MSLHVYGFVRGPGAAAVAGLEGAPVGLVPMPGASARGPLLSALTSPCSRAAHASAPTDRDLVAHDEVLAFALDRFESVVPVRFGRPLEEAEVAHVMARHRREIEADAVRLRRTVEFGARFTIARVPDERPAPLGPGERYLRERLLVSEFAALRRRALPLDAELGKLARERDEGTRPGGQRAELLLSFLARRADAARFRAALEADAVRGGDERVTMRWTGPWAPYSFVRMVLRD